MCCEVAGCLILAKTITKKLHIKVFSLLPLHAALFKYIHKCANVKNTRNVENAQISYVYMLRSQKYREREENIIIYLWINKRKKAE